MANDALKKLILDFIGPKELGASQRELEDNMPVIYTKNDIVGAVRIMISESLVYPYRVSTSEMRLRILSEEDKRRLHGLTEDDITVLNRIRTAGRLGIWKKNLRELTRLSHGQLTKSIKALETRDVIKKIIPVDRRHQPHYFMADEKPSRRVTGGVWFTDRGVVDTVMVDKLCAYVADYINVHSPVSLPNVVEHFVNPDAQPLTSELQKEDIEQLVDRLVYDGLVKKVDSRSYDNNGGGGRRNHWASSAAGGSDDDRDWNENESYSSDEKIEFDENAVHNDDDDDEEEEEAQFTDDDDDDNNNNNNNNNNKKKKKTKNKNNNPKHSRKRVKNEHAADDEQSQLSSSSSSNTPKSKPSKRTLKKKRDIQSRRSAKPALVNSDEGDGSEDDNGGSTSRKKQNLNETSSAKKQRPHTNVEMSTDDDDDASAGLGPIRNRRTGGGKKRRLRKIGSKMADTDDDDDDEDQDDDEYDDGDVGVVKGRDTKSGRVGKKRRSIGGASSKKKKDRSLQDIKDGRRRGLDCESSEDSKKGSQSLLESDESGDISSVPSSSSDEQSAEQSEASSGSGGTDADAPKSKKAKRKRDNGVHRTTTVARLEEKKKNERKRAKERADKRRGWTSQGYSRLPPVIQYENTLLIRTGHPFYIGWIDAVPCGKCEVAHQCSPDGVINPMSCPYMEDWKKKILSW